MPDGSKDRPGRIYDFDWRTLDGLDGNGNGELRSFECADFRRCGVRARQLDSAGQVRRTVGFDLTVGLEGLGVERVGQELPVD